MDNRNNEEKGLVFNIQRYSLHDGPGIRTTVFMKGCPLRCWWCQNPEAWKSYPELMVSERTCLKLGRCVDECPEGAISIREKKRNKVDRSKCNLCFRCVDVCPAKALKKVGDYMTVEEVLQEVERDTLFYRKSGGGITVSGGEPLYQASFTLSLLKECKKRFLQTALDTCGYVRWSTLEKALEYVDLLLYDIKHMDPQIHRQGTGKSNRLILDNLRKVNSRTRVWLRIPFIPNYNDSNENLMEIGKLGREINAERVSILPFNKFGGTKYRQLDMRNKMAKLETPSVLSLQRAKEIIERFNLEVAIGE